MSGYRERRDPHEIALDFLREAFTRESQAMIAKSAAEIDLQKAEAQREAAWQDLGARTNLVRHLAALERSFADARARAERASEPPDPERARAVLERLEAERAAFLRERGVEPGPALTEARPSVDASEVARQLGKAREDVEAAEADIRAADEQIAGARAEVERALGALAEATRARIEAQAEAKRFTG